MFEREKIFNVTVYNDPDHAWGKVRRDVLKNLKIDKYVSRFSYQRGAYVYLEEDNDLSLLCQTLHANNTRIIFNEKHSSKPSRVRTYEHYQPE